MSEELQRVAMEAVRRLEERIAATGALFPLEIYSELTEPRVFTNSAGEERVVIEQPSTWHSDLGVSARAIQEEIWRLPMTDTTFRALLKATGRNFPSAVGIDETLRRLCEGPSARLRRETRGDQTYYASIATETGKKLRKPRRPDSVVEAKKTAAMADVFGQTGEILSIPKAAQKHGLSKSVLQKAIKDYGAQGRYKEAIAALRREATEGMVPPEDYESRGTGR